MTLESILNAFRKAEGEQKDKAYSGFIEACMASQILAIVHSYGSKTYFTYVPGAQILEREEFFPAHGLKPSFEIEGNVVLISHPYAFGFKPGTFGVVVAEEKMEEQKSKVVGASSVSIGVASYCPNLEKTLIKVPSKKQLRSHMSYFKNPELRDLASQMIG